MRNELLANSCVLALEEGLRISAVVISISCTYTFTGQVYSSCTGHQELTNSTYI
jgi:hypothetical protein